MGVAFQVGNKFYEVGSSSFLHSFFSTISYHLEPKGWGTQYPNLLIHLYAGKLSWAGARAATEELEEIRTKLSAYRPQDVIWDIEDLSKRPPWGNNISSDITSPANYFVTSDGKDLVDVLLMATRDSLNNKTDIEIVCL